MRFTFIYSGGFVDEWKRLGLTDDDMASLERAIVADPEVGPVVAGTGGMRKMRFAPPSRHQGKSGALRVGYVVLVRDGKVHVLLVFPKNEKANLCDADKKRIKQWIALLKQRGT